MSRKKMLKVEECEVYQRVDSESIVSNCEPIASTDLSFYPHSPATESVTDLSFYPHSPATVCVTDLSFYPHSPATVCEEEGREESDTINTPAGSLESRCIWSVCTKHHGETGWDVTVILSQGSEGGNKGNLSLL